MEREKLKNILKNIEEKIKFQSDKEKEKYFQIFAKYNVHKKT